MQKLTKILNGPGRNKRLGTPVIACVISMSRSALIDLTRTDGRSNDNNHFRGDPQQKKLFSLSFTFTDFWVHWKWFFFSIFIIYESSAIISINEQYSGLGKDFVKWSASSWWWSSLYCSMRNSGEMTIGKTRPTLQWSPDTQISCRSNDQVLPRMIYLNLTLLSFLKWNLFPSFDWLNLNLNLENWIKCKKSCQAKETIYNLYLMYIQYRFSLTQHVT